MRLSLSLFAYATFPQWQTGSRILAKEIMSLKHLSKGQSVLVGLVLLLLCASPICTTASWGQDKEQLSNKVYDYSIGCWWRKLIVDKLMTISLSPGLWTKMMEDDGWGIKTVNNMAIDMGEFAKNHGYGDLEAAESANNNDRNANKPQVESMVDALRGKVGFNLKADGVKGSPAEWDLIHRYMSTVGDEIASSSFKPKGNIAIVTLVASATAKDIAVTVTPDGGHFTVVAPTLVEPSEWDTKIQRGLERAK